ncbi:MAG: hypothetical protein Fur0024_1250 [Patescibacteria group bacterium]
MTIQKYIISIFISSLLSLLGLFSVINFTDPFGNFGNFNRIVFFISLWFSCVSIFTLIFYFLKSVFSSKLEKKYFEILEKSFKSSFFFSTGVLIFFILKMINIFNIYTVFGVSSIFIIFGEIFLKLKIKSSLKKIDR